MGFPTMSKSWKNQVYTVINNLRFLVMMGFYQSVR